MAEDLAENAYNSECYALLGVGSQFSNSESAQYEPLIKPAEGMGICLCHSCILPRHPSKLLRKTVLHPMDPFLAEAESEWLALINQSHATNKPLYSDSSQQAGSGDELGSNKDAGAIVRLDDRR